MSWRLDRHPLTTSAPAPKRASPLWPESREIPSDPIPEPAPATEPEAPDLNLAHGDALLAPGLLEGLDRSLCERLVAQGVRTLETLTAMTELSFARTVGIPYTKLIELQYQARRRSRDIIVPAAPPPSRQVTFPRIPPLPARPPAQADPQAPITNEVSGPFV